MPLLIYTNHWEEVGNKPISFFYAKRHPSQAKDAGTPDLAILPLLYYSKSAINLLIR
ncbi:hypothetical protein B0I21_101301 [Sphingobacterium paludis]|uniref:Uncharacterized protein n=1 Tax=Sphingobacterium paludis TaxID=1476465 RepID=A0A4R7DE36_9SPHI|nr:hypothetical protein B0I21_101301 [Sphingobacterium paludis]